MQRNKHLCKKTHLTIKDVKTIMTKRYVNQFLYINLKEPGIYQYLKFVRITKSKLSIMPKGFGVLSRLKELDLSGNNLGANENDNWSWLEQIAIRKSLLALNLSNNSLTKFPIQIGKLNALIILNISHNKLTYLPQCIQNLKRLAFLNVSDNDLSYLPENISKLTMMYYANISENSFSNDQISCIDNLGMPSLVELSTKIIIARKIAYDASIIPYTLIRYIDNAKYCSNCGSACIDRYIREITDRIPSTIVAPFVIKTTRTLQFECYYCSVNCYNKYHDYMLRNWM